MLYSRRFSVWLLSFLAVLVIYFIYHRLSRTPPITTNQPGQIVKIMDACDTNTRAGMMGDVGIGVVKNVRYVTLNAQKQIEREFGFEKLLHQDGNDWEIEKPYVRIYKRNFTCELKGRTANVEVETAGGRVTPKDGRLSGDVTVRIWPHNQDSLGETIIYLDDITFIGDRSLFSTPGMVEIISDKIHMVGTGMDLIYNGDSERLEFLKIAKLQNLIVNQWSKNKTLNSAVTAGSEVNNQTVSKPGQKYRCVIDSNVVIETPQERLIANLISLDDIFVPDKSEDENNTDSLPSDKPIPQSSDFAESRRATGAVAGDVSVKCDGSVMVIPMDYPAEQLKTVAEQNGLSRQEEENLNGKTTFQGERIDYNIETGIALSTGPSQIRFNANDKKLAAADEPAKVKITSQKQAHFDPASNKAVFEGDCSCTVSQSQGNTVREYMVFGDKLQVDLKQAGADKGSASSLDVQRLIATGDVVRLATTKKSGWRLLDGVEMKCVRMDYDAIGGNFLATGPGLIKIDNSQADEPQEKMARFSLQRKCYAFLRNFDSLAFSSQNNLLTADSQTGSLLVDYFPIPDSGKQEDKIAVTASHVEANIVETSQGRTELKALTAKGAVTYEDKDNQFAGSEFIYDSNNGVININGNKNQPCLFNGAIVDTVRYDLKTGKASTRIKGPGTLK